MRTAQQQQQQQQFSFTPGSQVSIFVCVLQLEIFHDVPFQILADPTNLTVSQ